MTLPFQRWREGFPDWLPAWLVRLWEFDTKQFVGDISSEHSDPADRIGAGTGGADEINSVTAHWPSGKAQLLTDVEVDRVITVVEP